MTTGTLSRPHGKKTLAACGSALALAALFAALIGAKPIGGHATDTGAPVYLTLTNGRETVAPGGSLTYVLTMSTEKEQLQTVSPELRLPAGVHLTSASEGGTLAAPGIVRWQNITVHKGNPKKLTVNVTVDYDAPDLALLVARAFAGTEQATDTTRVEGPKAVTGRFFLSLSDGKQHVAPGERLHYTLRVRNGHNITRTTDVSITFPTFMTFVSASEGGVSERSDIVVWKNITLEPGEERNFTFVGNVYERASENFQLVTTASAGGYRATDSTLITRGIPMGHITAHIFADRERAERGQLLTYTIEIRNRSDRLGVEEYVNAAMPMYAEFVDVREGGYWDGKNVRWTNIHIAPNGVRRLSFTVRVRSDAPIGTELIGSVQVDGGYDAHYAQVVRAGQGGPFDGRDPSDSTRHVTHALLRKVPGSDQAVPGSHLTYTISVKNILDRPVTHVRLSDRFDSTHLSFVGADKAPAHAGAAELEWVIPALAPGETWQVRYTLAVSAHAPQGFKLTNIATVSGPDIDHVPLTERVRTVHTGVLTSLPTTGAAWDLLFVYASFVMAGGSLALQQTGRKMLA